MHYRRRSRWVGEELDLADGPGLPFVRSLALVEEAADDAEKDVGTRDMVAVVDAAESGTRDAGADGRGLLGQSPFLKLMYP